MQAPGDLGDLAVAQHREAAPVERVRPGEPSVPGFQVGLGPEDGGRGDVVPQGYQLGQAFGESGSGRSRIARLLERERQVQPADGRRPDVSCPELCITSLDPASRPRSSSWPG